MKPNSTNCDEAEEVWFDLIRAAECTEWAVTESRAAIMIEDTQESRDRLATAIALHAETAKLLADHRAKMLADYRKTEVGE